MIDVTTEATLPCEDQALGCNIEVTLGLYCSAESYSPQARSLGDLCA